MTAKTASHQIGEAQIERRSDRDLSGQ